jgi:hypothetical protein
VGEGGTTAGVLDAGPGEGGVEVVAAVHEEGAGLDAGAEGDGRRLGVGGPDGGGEAVGAVVHVADGFGVAVDGQDADDRAEALFLHEQSCGASATTWGAKNQPSSGVVKSRRPRGAAAALAGVDDLGRGTWSAVGGGHGARGWWSDRVGSPSLA